MRLGMWNVRSLYRTGSLKTVARELGKCKLDLGGVQEVRSEKGALNGQRIIHFSMEKGRRIISQGQIFSYIRESYQWLEEWSLLATGCHIKY
jgi:hypothetical protein